MAIMNEFPSLEEIWKIREHKYECIKKKEFLTNFNKKEYKAEGYGNGMNGYMLMENLLTRNDYCIIDSKCTTTEDIDRYQNFHHEEKLFSYGKNKYMNFQGLRIVNSFGIRRLFSKNLIKYESLDVQKQIVREVFRLPQEEQSKNHKFDLVSIQKLIKELEELLKVLEYYQVNFIGASVLIYYSSFAKEIKLNFLDLSYFPEKLKFEDIKGIVIMIDVLKQILTD